MSTFNVSFLHQLRRPSTRLCPLIVAAAMLAAGCQGVADSNKWDSIHDPAFEGFVPDTPTLTLLERRDEHSLVVNWERRSKYDVGFAVYRQAPNNAFMQIGAQSIDSTSFCDTTTFDPSIPYRYKVAALSKHGLPGFSATVTYDPGLQPPTLLSVKRVGTGIWIRLEWKKINYGKYVRIERSLDSGPFVMVGSVSSNSTSFDIDDAGSTSVTFRLRAMTDTNASVSSNAMRL